MAGKFKVKFTPLLTKIMVCFLLFVPSRTGDGVVIGRRRSTPTSQAAAADHLT